MRTGALLAIAASSASIGLEAGLKGGKVEWSRNLPTSRAGRYGGLPTSTTTCVGPIGSVVKAGVPGSRSALAGAEPNFGWPEMGSVDRRMWARRASDGTDCHRVPRLRRQQEQQEKHR